MSNKVTFDHYQKAENFNINEADPGNIAFIQEGDSIVTHNKRFRTVSWSKLKVAQKKVQLSWDKPEVSYPWDNVGELPTIQCANSNALGQVTYSSNNPSVADVVDGKIVVKDNITGSATITATLETEQYIADPVKTVITINKIYPILDWEPKSISVNNYDEGQIIRNSSISDLLINPNSVDIVEIVKTITREEYSGAISPEVVEFNLDGSHGIICDCGSVNIAVKSKENNLYLSKTSTPIQININGPAIHDSYINGGDWNYKWNNFPSINTWGIMSFVRNFPNNFFSQDHQLTISGWRGPLVLAIMKPGQAPVEWYDEWDMENRVNGEYLGNYYIYVSDLDAPGYPNSSNYYAKNSNNIIPYTYNSRTGYTPGGTTVEYACYNIPDTGVHTIKIYSELIKAPVPPEELWQQDPSSTDDRPIAAFCLLNPFLPETMDKYNELKGQFGLS